MKINYTAKENLIFLPDREWVLFGVRRAYCHRMDFLICLGCYL